MIVYIDMDDTLADYSGAYTKLYPMLTYPQSMLKFFIGLEPLEGAIDAVNRINAKHTVYFLTAPSIKNTHCYSEKAEWINRYFGEPMLERLIISPNKALLRGHYLIDDNTHGRGIEGFEGELIHFKGSWQEVLTYLNC